MKNVKRLIAAIGMLLFINVAMFAGDAESNEATFEEAMGFDQWVITESDEGITVNLYLQILDTEENTLSCIMELDYGILGTQELPCPGMYEVDEDNILSIGLPGSSIAYYITSYLDGYIGLNEGTEYPESALVRVE